MFREILKIPVRNVILYPKDAKVGAAESKIVKEAERIAVTHPLFGEENAINFSLIRNGGKLLFDIFLGTSAGFALGLFLDQKLDLLSNPALYTVTLITSLSAGAFMGGTWEFARDGRHLRKTEPEKYQRISRKTL